MGNYSIQDRFDHDEHRAWHDQYSVGRRANPYLAPHEGPQSVGPADTFPGPKYDTISSGHQDNGINPGFKLDVLAPPIIPTVISTGGVSVFLGKDAAGAAAMDVKAPEDMFSGMIPTWLKELRPVEEDIRARKKKNIDELAPGSGGFLAALGRFVAIPLSRAANIFERVGVRAFDFLVRPLVGPMATMGRAVGRFSNRLYNRAVAFLNRWVPVFWGPVERTLERSFNWIGNQIQRAQPYLEAGYNWVKSRGKRVLDAIIIEAPLAAWTSLKQLPGRLAGWLDRTANWLWD